MKKTNTSICQTASGKSDNDCLSDAVAQIRNLLDGARANVVREVNVAMLKAYWEIGHVIVEYEQDGDAKARYGARILTELAKRLAREIGRGFSKSNLYYMRDFYVKFPIFQTVSGKLTWSHYIELLAVDDEDARAFYEKECVAAKWSVKELNRQIGTSLFERLLLSSGKGNREKVLALATRGNTPMQPSDVLKQPFVFEFLGIPENKPLPEKTLERKLLRHLEDFLLELGRGFMFVGSQQRVTLGGRHYYVDLVFYNKILKAYILIDLKTGELQPEHAGQMNAYLNYFRTEVNDVGDNPPVGIILCKTKRDIVAEYALGGLSNKVFSSSYVCVIPEKERLIAEVKNLLESQKKNRDD